ncbi:hypothetical protein DL762_004642 [Monosporascus cannonballus]|uniref:Uncharacterized protein n=1 Tax=Monosporascus cannonballus TaxID=155416 RepID=A0ABY0H746_9PEZI|nr:hypothetical protein DL762_004642 [Monosporascus cannonballus]
MSRWWYIRPHEYDVALVTPGSLTQIEPVLREWIEESDRLTDDPEYVEDEVFGHIADENSMEGFDECNGHQNGDLEQGSIERSIPRGPRLQITRVIRALLHNERTDGLLKDLNGQTAFHIVVSDGSGARELPALMKYFLALRRFSPNTPDSECRTALHLATSLHLDREPGRRVIMGTKTLLKDSRLDLTRLDNKKQTPIYAAVTADFTAAVKLLDDGRVGLNAQEDMGDTALHKAVALGRKEIVQLLLHDPKPNRRVVNGSGETALMIARRIEVGVAELSCLFRVLGRLTELVLGPGRSWTGRFRLEVLLSTVEHDSVF